MLVHFISGESSLMGGPHAPQCTHDGNGLTVEELCRKKSITVQTYYSWKKEYGGTPTDQLKRMKQLEEENRRLRKAVSDFTLDNQILQEVSKGNY